MQPILLDLEFAGVPIVAHSYTAFLLLAALAGLALGVRAMVGLGVTRSRALAGLALVIAAGLVGARAFSVALDWEAYAADPAAIVALRAHGLALYGGLAAATVAGVVVVRWWGIALARAADAVVPAVASGLVLVRIGCFLNGCCAGRPTSLPWGVRFPVGSHSWEEQASSGELGLFGLTGEPRPVHPTQLYDIATFIVAAVLAGMVRRSRAPSGAGALTFVAVTAGSRAFVQLYRVPSTAATLPAWVEPSAYAVVAMVAIAGLALLLAGARPARKLLARAGA